VPPVETIGVADRAAGDPGIVDQDVEPAIGRQRFVDQALPLGFVGDVDLGGNRRPATVDDRRGNSRRLIGQDVRDNNFGTLGREEPGLRFAHAMGGAGNNRNLVF